MITFDNIIPTLAAMFRRRKDIEKIQPILINRDLNGRIRLILDEKWENDAHARQILDEITLEMQTVLAPHGYPPDRALLFESDFEAFLKQEPIFPLEDQKGVYIVDRLVTGNDWSTISVPSMATPRIVFFSIKGGVGRSTALAATAWAIAETGKRVLVLDLDLESPGLSSSLLPEDRRPAFGIADWLIEDLVENGDMIFQEMVASSPLSHNGEIHVVPAHGLDPGEYIAKLGRAWMPKINSDGYRERWSERLNRLLADLENEWMPDVVFIDSRAGIDDVASACLTDLAASLILLFAIDGDQTWTDYRILFRHWRTRLKIQEIRERLQMVAAMIPEIGTNEYYRLTREHAWLLFADEIFDEVPAGEVSTEAGSWSFDESDAASPHCPWPIRWNRGFAALKSLHGKLIDISPEDVHAVFGPLISNILPFIETE